MHPQGHVSTGSVADSRCSSWLPKQVPALGQQVNPQHPSTPLTLTFLAGSDLIAGCVTLLLPHSFHHLRCVRAHRVLIAPP
jgi:hypothetical protein